METILQQGASALGLSLDEKALSLFGLYMRELRAWNEKINLTRITEPEEIAVKHFLDSLTCARAASFEGRGRVIDIGTGAGFPGVPLKIVFPGIRLTLLDSLQKRIAFLDSLIEALRLEEAEAVHARAEDAGRSPKMREGYDIALFRALSSLPALAELGLPFLKKGGRLIAMKGPEGESEIPGARKAIAVCGGEFPEVIRLTLPETDMERRLIVIEKISPTPPAYPRRPGLPEKKPL
ncbi:MAG: 16S rRNA (guanine(527)-N(7))-methyltransferase RsmG [Armatimonadetes bacterium]|nr:16S rRNA (guanine(527)-N(7))-methyltransferase RsmG [Armatimonadota bacterium]